MPSRMATIAITTISSVIEKPVCRFMGRQCTGRGARANRPCVTLAGPIRRTACRDLWAVGRGAQNAPKRARHSDYRAFGPFTPIDPRRPGCVQWGATRVQLPSDAQLSVNALGPPFGDLGRGGPLAGPWHAG